MERRQLDLRIEQILIQVDNQRLTVSNASKEIGKLFDDFISGESYEEKKAAGL